MTIANLSSARKATAAANWEELDNRLYELQRSVIEFSSLHDKGGSAISRHRQEFSKSRQILVLYCCYLVPLSYSMLPQLEIYS